MLQGFWRGTTRGHRRQCSLQPSSRRQVGNHVDVTASEGEGEAWWARTMEHCAAFRSKYSCINESRKTVVIFKKPEGDLDYISSM